MFSRHLKKSSPTINLQAVFSFQGFSLTGHPSSWPKGLLTSKIWGGGIALEFSWFFPSDWPCYLCENRRMWWWQPRSGVVIQGSLYDTNLNNALFPLHPWKLTCHLKRDYFNRKYIFQSLIFRGHASFPGSISFNMTIDLQFLMPEKWVPFNDSLL